MQHKPFRQISDLLLGRATGRAIDVDTAVVISYVSLLYLEERPESIPPC